MGDKDFEQRLRARHTNENDNKSLRTLCKPLSMGGEPESKERKMDQSEDPQLPSPVDHIRVSSPGVLLFKPTRSLEVILQKTIQSQKAKTEMMQQMIPLHETK